MKHPIYRVTNFEVVAPYTLTIEFNDGLLRTINFQPALVGEVFGPLREPSVFNAVKIDPEVWTLVWPNGADFDPAMPHHRPVYEAALHERVRSWGDVRTCMSMIHRARSS